MIIVDPYWRMDITPISRHHLHHHCKNTGPVDSYYSQQTISMKALLIQDAVVVLLTVSEFGRHWYYEAGISVGQRLGFSLLVDSRIARVEESEGGRRGLVCISISGTEVLTNFCGVSP